MKNAKGTGSVYKMKDCKRRKTWRAVSPATRNKITGKLERINIGTYETKNEALEALSKFNQNPYSADIKKLTFLDVADRWKKEHLPKVGEHRQKAILSRLNMLTPLYNLIFIDIKLIDLQSFLNSLNIASGTKKEYKAIFNLIFTYAIKYEITYKNPAQFIDLGRHKKVREAGIFTEDEIQKLWKYQLLKNVDIILILIYTGLRIGELLDLEKEKVFIEERYIIAGSKTEAGKDRLIPLHKDLIPMIKRRYEESNIYLIETKGKKITYMTAKRLFDQVLEALKLPNHNPHDTRHTFATLLNNAEANKTAITNIMGHSDFKLTEKVYTHKDKTELIKAIDMIDLKQG